MRVYILALGISLSVAPAIAQTSPANPSSTTPAVSTPNTTNPQAPVPGANSFTEGQAKSRIEFKRLFRRFRIVEGRPRCLAGQGHEGRKVHGSHRRLSGQRRFALISPPSHTFNECAARIHAGEKHDRYNFSSL